MEFSSRDCDLVVFVVNQTGKDVDERRHMMLITDRDINFSETHSDSIDALSILPRTAIPRSRFNGRNMIARSRTFAIGERRGEVERKRFRSHRLVVSAFCFPNSPLSFPSSFHTSSPGRYRRWAQRCFDRYSHDKWRYRGIVNDLLLLSIISTPQGHHHGARIRNSILITS